MLAPFSILGIQAFLAEFAAVFSGGFFAFLAKPPPVGHVRACSG